MSQTVGALSSGQTYRVRSKNAELYVAASQATKSSLRGPGAGIPSSKEGKG